MLERKGLVSDVRLKDYVNLTLGSEMATDMFDLNLIFKNIKQGNQEERVMAESQITGIPYHSC